MDPQLGSVSKVYIHQLLMDPYGYNNCYSFFNGVLTYQRAGENSGFFLQDPFNYDVPDGMVLSSTWKLDI